MQMHHYKKNYTKKYLQKKHYFKKYIKIAINLRNIKVQTGKIEL